MGHKGDFDHQTPTGQDLLKILEALANPHRLRIVAALTGGRIHVSQLARMLHLSRPLLYMHLQRLEHAGLVSSKLELSPDGKAMKYYEVTAFALRLTPERIARAAADLQPDQTDGVAPDMDHGKGTRVDDE